MKQCASEQIARIPALSLSLSLSLSRVDFASARRPAFWKSAKLEVLSWSISCTLSLRETRHLFLLASLARHHSGGGLNFKATTEQLRQAMAATTSTAPSIPILKEWGQVR